MTKLGFGSKVLLFPYYVLRCPVHGENKLIFNEIMMRSALYKTNTVSWISFYSACSLKQQSAGRPCRPNRTHHPDYESTSFCSFSLMLRA
jgi:hypothetical protein